MPLKKRRFTNISLYISVAATTVTVALCCLFVLSSKHFVIFCSITRDTGASLTAIASPSDINQSDVCTVETFRKHYRSKDYFPGDGRWDRFNASYRFVPALCKFHFDGFRRLPGIAVRRCLRRRNVTRIMTVGDSNAARYYSALLTVLQRGDRHWRCVNTSVERIEHTMLLPDVRY